MQLREKSNVDCISRPIQPTQNYRKPTKACFAPYDAACRTRTNVENFVLELPDHDYLILRGARLLGSDQVLRHCQQRVNDLECVS